MVRIVTFAPFRIIVEMYGRLSEHGHSLVVFSYFESILSGSGMIFICTNSFATAKRDSYESTKPKNPNFLAFVVLQPCQCVL